MRTAITGPYGRLGSELVSRGCIPIEANVTNFYALNNAIRDIKPKVVVHCAAKTNVDGCESQAIDAMTTNAGGTHNLAQIFHGKIVYISTDYVFDGEGGPYTETAKPNPISIYGWSKLGGEISLINRKNPSDLIIRTTVLFDKKGTNFVTAVIKKLLSGTAITVPKRLYGSPTYVPHLADGILAAIERDVNGVLNIAGDLVVSRYQLACEIGKLLKIDKPEISPGPTLGRAPRPVNAGLIIDRALMLKIPIFNPLEGVKEVIRELATMETGRSGNN